MIGIKNTLREDLYTFLIISSSFLLRIRIVSGKNCGGKKIKIHFVFNNFFFVENSGFYATMWKNIVELGRTQMKIWRMRIACWISKARGTHSECVLLVAFPLRQW